jgi:tetratricopeptide (TPR) repeat protein
MEKTLKKSLLIFLTLLLAFCAPRKKVEITPQQLVEYNIKIKEAETLFHSGSYVSLKEAFQIYQDILSIPLNRIQTKENLVKTALLLTLRAKELGILNDTYIEEASNLIQNSPRLSGYSICLDAVNSIAMKSAGIPRGSLVESSSISARFENIRKNIGEWRRKLKEKSTTEEFFAYIYISLNCRHSSFIKEKADLSYFLDIFPSSPLILYKLSLCPKENEDRLKELIEKEPLFYEAYYFLGQIALRYRRFITAEKNFLKSYDHIPESPSIAISLASIYFAFEELKKSLELYEETLKLAPAFRDAILGKAICLSYLGKNEEAIEACNSLIKLENYYLGDAHYWLAWNQNELERLDEAWENIEESKKYLIGYSQVPLLAGVIAFKKENLDVAEKNLKEAYKLNATNCEAPFYLGKIYTRYQQWEKSGTYFEKAALCNFDKEKTLEKRIEEIEKSAFSEGRKKRLISMKKIQLKKRILTKATLFYNAAAGYFNAGMKRQALRLAQQAAFHSSIKDKAEELIRNIKNQDL